jgi:hypothetical protein
MKPEKKARLERREEAKREAWLQKCDNLHRKYLQRSRARKYGWEGARLIEEAPQEEKLALMRRFERNRPLENTPDIPGMSRRSRGISIARTDARGGWRTHAWQALVRRDERARNPGARLDREPKPSRERKPRPSHRRNRLAYHRGHERAECAEIIQESMNP